MDATSSTDLVRRYYDAINRRAVDYEELFDPDVGAGRPRRRGRRLPAHARNHAVCGFDAVFT